MKLIESSVQIIKEKDPYKMIELAGRTCYKSEDKITENSAKEFVDRMIKLGHGAMLEHGTVYLDLSNSAGDYDLVPFFASNKYSKINIVSLEDRVHNYITTNFRVLVENFTEDSISYILQYQCEPTEYHEKRITAKFICDRGVSHEFVRHRVFSFAQESTRYCNYSKDKFGNELTFIKPSWGYFKNISYKDAGYFDGDVFESSLKKAESYYFKLIEKGWKPQQARQVLPNATKTELVMTGFESDWEGFFKLRCSGAAHPDAKKLADELRELMVK